jgi:hypothetical protein
VSLLLAGCDDQGPHLYQVDPSGSFFAWKASAIGKNTQSAKDFLEKRYSLSFRLCSFIEHPNSFTVSLAATIRKWNWKTPFTRRF